MRTKLITMTSRAPWHPYKLGDERQRSITKGIIKKYESENNE